MSTAVLLYTMRCNIACAHCSVLSSPDRRGAMALDQALALVDGLAAAPGVRYIDISGGEPMLHPDEVIAVIRRIKGHGKEVRLTTNGFWAATQRRAEAMLRRLKEAGLDAVGLSLDKWHLDFLPAGLARNFVDACRTVGFPPLVSCVVRGDPTDPRSGAPDDLKTLLDYYGLSRERATDLQAWGAQMDRLSGPDKSQFLAETVRTRLLVNWQYLAGEGRAAALLRDETVWTPLEQTPEEPCPIAGKMPTIDRHGNLFPCCAPWVNHKSRAYARVDGASVGPALATMRDRPALEIIRRFGPKRLMVALMARGHRFPACNSGICNQCGQMLTAVDLDEMDRAAHDVMAAERQSS